MDSVSILKISGPGIDSKKRGGLSNASLNLQGPDWYLD